MRRTAGFSLVEVMCAILILAIGVFGLTQGIAAAFRSSKESELQSVAALFAAGVIETLRAEGYYVDGVTEGECGEGLAPYRWKQSITRSDLDGLHEVSVEIQDSRTGQLIYELRTLLFMPPVAATLDSPADRKNSQPKKRGGIRP
jgi:type IV pilus modification protein PilV